jgi:hypothetical protein
MAVSFIGGGKPLAFFNRAHITNVTTFHINRKYFK